MKSEFGTCCVCEAEIYEIAYIVDLPYKLDQKTKSKWGCFTCGLPIEGGIAIVCAICIESPTVETDIKFAMNGFDKRVPVPPKDARVPHQHDLTQHADEIGGNPDERHETPHR